MKFLLIGCNGKMGRTIAKLAQEYNDIVACGIDTKDLDQPFKTYQTTHDVKDEIDAIIDFSTAENHIEFIDYALKNQIPYGLFSTILDQSTKDKLKKASKHIPILHCKNASVGVNILYEMIDLCSKKLTNCESLIQEYHHKEKLDKPSGTAKDIEKILSKHNIAYETSSYRVGKETGTHIIQFFLQDETITLIHTANSRDVFARGAILAMHKLKEKENDLYLSP